MTAGYIDLRDLPHVNGTGRKPSRPHGDPRLAAPPENTGEQKGARPITATPFVWREPAQIPARRWIYGQHFIRDFVTATIAPGGLGKSSLELVEALAIVTGRPLLGVYPNERTAVWLWNGEDPRDELDRRIAAACLHHGVTPAELEGRLFVDSGRDTEIVLAEETRNGTQIIMPVFAAMVDTIRANGIGLVIIDPFVSSHRVSENDNRSIDQVVKAWARIAGICGCCIELVHHARKTGGAEVTVEASRGAVALTDAARSARALNGMTKEEAASAGVEKPRAYFRVDNGKANLSAPPDKAAWFHLASVDLDNGRTPNAPGDNVGAVESWTWPDPLDGMTVADLDKVRAFVGTEPKWRESPQSPEWVGHAIAQVLGMDTEAKHEKSRIKSMLAVWRGSGALKVIEALDSKRNARNFVVSGDA
ncbi:AAA family ATPase [Terrihabitans rhizophilus]|uniref:AAA family ATPase n=1 Tax=Terrihabitans rhizophilus TaxID=3092662 RepID=A0ABU4RQP3_9HYPH|nr:AAA family ATPase [Terrihabitans sp. PJ23]MDX6807170.1 AAA family ATPase [Terrihabitans sp. PJ23]